MPSILQATLADSAARVREDIARIQTAAGLRHEVRIVAVTKGHGPEAVRAAVGAGLADLGENRVQEALAKRAAVGALPARWHLIGHLQTNKARSVPGVFSLVHSVDSDRLADALAQAVRRAAELGGGVADPLEVLLQVNLAGEAQKGGCDPAAVDELVAHIGLLPQLRLTGLMTMAPFTDDERVQRQVFGGLRTLRDRLAAAGRPVHELSMGMSGDYRAAVAEGATLLRLGTILFGARAT